MTEAVKGSPLTNPRVKSENLNQRVEENILQFQIFAAIFPLSIPAVPCVAQRIPPHMNRGIQRLAGKKAFKKNGHGFNAFLAAG